jgi:hypothetical protein
MLLAGQASKFLWIEVAHIIVQLLNSLPTKANNGTMSEERFSGIKSNLSTHRVFGCVAFVHLDKFERDKLSSHSNLGIHLGLHDESKAYRIYIPSLKKVQIIRNVVFDENCFLTTPLADSTFSLASLYSLTRYPIDVSSNH